MATSEETLQAERTAQDARREQLQTEITDWKNLREKRDCGETSTEEEWRHSTVL